MLAITLLSYYKKAENLGFLNMPRVILVSQHRDFTDVVSELAKSELGVECVIMEDEQKARAAQGAVVLTDKQPPFRMRELLAAMERAKHEGAETVLLEDCQLSVPQKALTQLSSKKSVSLTDKETQLLVLLTKAGSKGVSKDMLLKDIWGVETELESHTLETHIYRLRAKLRDIGAQVVLTALPGKYVCESKDGK